MREKVENDGELSNKILDLCLHQQIEESYQYMKLKSYYEDIDLIEDQICGYYVQIEKEIRIIEEMKTQISYKNK